MLPHDLAVLPELDPLGIGADLDRATNSAAIHISVRGSFLDADHPATGSILHACSQVASRTLRFMHFPPALGATTTSSEGQSHAHHCKAPNR